VEQKKAWLALILLTVALRIPGIVDGRQIGDESFYSVIGNIVLDGGELYVDAVDRKPPLLFYSYAGFFALVGKYNFEGLHTLALLVTLATMLALYVVARRLFDWRVGIAAAFFYSVFAITGDYRNAGMNASLLMNLPIVIALGLLFGGRERKLRLELLVAGALLGVAFLYKQPAAIAAIPMGLYLLLPAYRSTRGLGFGYSILHGALLTTGFAAVLGAFAWWLHGKGILEAALHWTFQTDFVHGPSDPVYWRFLAVYGGLSFALMMAPLLACAAASVGRKSRTLLWTDRRAELQGLVLLLAFSWIGVAASGRFAPHHFTQMLPSVCLLAAPVLVGIYDRRLEFRFPLLRRGVLLWTLGILVTCFALAQAITFQLRFRGGETPAFVKSITDSDDCIFVWGPSPDFYLDAERCSASRYVATFPLTGYIFGSPLTWDPDHDPSSRIHPGAWEELARELDEAPPKVLVDEFSLRGGGKYELGRYPYLRALVEERYELLHETPEARIYLRIAGDSPSR
jgi:4-amino-4-deoxy-L-arabinose transferase-like glycosyltransferase